MRKFNPSRFYKVLKVTLLILTLLLAFHLLFGGKSHNASYHKLSTDDMLCDTLYPIDTNNARRFVCYDEATKNFDRNYDDENQFNKFEFILILGLPILFFGGSRLYKYLFPEK